MKNNIRVIKMTNVLKEIKLSDGTSGLASKRDGKWELSPNIRSHAKEISGLLDVPDTQE